MKGSNNQKGFTLIELLIVIAIMAILTIITVPQFVTAKMRARDVARKGDLNALSKALQMYFADYGEFPEDINGGNDSENWGTDFKDSANYVYMKVLPKSSTTIPYCYVVSGDKKSFALFAMLENTKDSGCHVDGDDNGVYNQCGNKYCYSVVSPNAVVGDF